MDKINLLESQALVHINDIQETFDYIQHNINIMKAELGKVGFEVEFERISSRVRTCKSGEKILNADGDKIPHIALKPFHSGGLLNKVDGNITICKVKKKNSDDVIVKTKAETAKGDINIELLGEYLSLARATRIVLGDYKEEN